MSSRCILATDMARHNEILNRFKMLQPVFDFNNKEHKEVVWKQPPKEHHHFSFIKKDTQVILPGALAFS